MTTETLPAKSPFYTPEHLAFRDAMRRFVAREISPHVDAWDEAESFPVDLYRKAAEIGLLGLGFPEAFGGNDGDLFMTIIAAQELARCGAGGVLASLLSHTIGCPPIVNVGSEALKQRVLPPVLRGEKISALGITEPSGGSDVANLKTTARGMATTTSSTARRCSSPPACAPTSTPWRCALAGRGQAACRCC